MFQRINIHPENPQSRLIEQAVKIMQKSGGGICIYPTDSIYGVGCAVSNIKKINEIAEILHKDKSRKFAFICSDITQANEYAEINDRNFKIMRKNTGAFTFILPSSRFVQRKISEKRKTIGIRITAFPATKMLIEMLGEPLANMSLNTDEEKHGNPDLYITPEVVNGVDVILDAGNLDGGESTIVDLTGDIPVILRQGKGIFNE